MDREKLLAAAGMPEERWAECHVTEDGMVFTPRVGHDGAVQATAQEVYAGWLERKEHPPAPTADPRDAVLAQLMRDVAALKAREAAGNV